MEAVAVIHAEAVHDFKERTDDRGGHLMEAVAVIHAEAVHDFKERTDDRGGHGSGYLAAYADFKPRVLAGVGYNALRYAVALAGTHAADIDNNRRGVLIIFFKDRSNVKSFFIRHQNFSFVLPTQKQTCAAHSYPR